jgi:hypothetical protein
VGIPWVAFQPIEFWVNLSNAFKADKCSSNLSNMDLCSLLSCLQIPEYILEDSHILPKWQTVAWRSAVETTGRGQVIVYICIIFAQACCRAFGRPCVREVLLSKLDQHSVPTPAP